MDDFFCVGGLATGLAFSFFNASNSRFISANCFATSSFKLKEVELVAVLEGGAEFGCGGFEFGGFEFGGFEFGRATAAVPAFFDGCGGAIGRFFDVDFDVDL